MGEKEFDGEPVAIKNAAQPETETTGLLDTATILASRWRFLITSSLLAGGVAVGVSFIMQPVYTAGTVVLPPAQQSSLSVSALAALGPLAGLAGSAGVKSSGEQYVALLQSYNVADRLIDKFNLIETYGVKLRADARKELGDRTSIALGKKDGLISLTVDDSSPQRAADLANGYISELQRLISDLALTEAQQRRRFFEGQQSSAKARLAEAQKQLEQTGISVSALNAEPKAAAEAVAKLKAELTSAQIRLQSLRTYLNDQTPAIQQLLSTIQSLQVQIQASAAPQRITDGQAGYLDKYREYKYQEALFDSFSRQLELARVDEAREGASVQIIDRSQVPERRTKPRRTRMALAYAVFGLLAASAYAIASERWQRFRSDPMKSTKWRAFLASFRR